MISDRAKRVRAICDRLAANDLERENLERELEKFVEPTLVAVSKNRQPAVGKVIRRPKIKSQRKGTAKRVLLTDKELEAGILKALSIESLSLSKILKKFHVGFSKAKTALVKLEKSGQIRRVVGNYTDENGKPRPGWGYTLSSKVGSVS